jgi:hypothetical protein
MMLATGLYVFHCSNVEYRSRRRCPLAQPSWWCQPPGLYSFFNAERRGAVVHWPITVCGDHRDSMFHCSIAERPVGARPLVHPSW